MSDTKIKTEETAKLNHELMVAIFEDNLLAVKAKLRKGANVNSLNPIKSIKPDLSDLERLLGEVTTPLYLAACLGHVEIVKHLVTEANPKAEFFLDIPPQILYVALSNYKRDSKYAETIQFILKTFPTLIRLKNESGESVLEWAVVHAKGDERSESSFKLVKMIYEANKPAIRELNIYDGTTVLMAAGRGINAKVFEFIHSEYPEAVNIKDQKGRSIAHVLMYAFVNTNYRSNQYLELILKRYPGLLHETDTEEYNLLEHGLLAGNFAAVEFLLKKYPELYKPKDKQNQSFLQKVIKSYWHNPREAAPIIEYILEKDKDAIQELDENGLNLLALEAKKWMETNNYDSAILVGELLSRGMSLQIFANDELAARFDRLFHIGSRTALTDEEYRLIENFGPALNMNSTQFHGTLLHVAVRNGNKELASRLLLAGASPERANSDKVTPLQYAKKQLVEGGEDSYFVDLLSFYKAKSLCWELIFAFRDKPSFTLAEVERLETKEREEGEIRDIKDAKDIKDNKEGEKKELVGKWESTFAAMQAISSDAFNILNHLADFSAERQIDILRELAVILAPDDYGNLLPSPNPLFAYKVLRKLDQNDPLVNPLVNKKMHYLLASDVILIPQAEGVEPKPMLREEFEKTSEAAVSEGKEAAERVRGLEEDIEEETEGEKQKTANPAAINRFNILIKIKHLTIAEPEAPELAFYMQEYVTGEKVKFTIVQQNKGALALNVQQNMDYLKIGNDLVERIKAVGIINNSNAIKEILELARGKYEAERFGSLADEARAEVLRQRDKAVRERDEAVRQRDEAVRERDEALREAKRLAEELRAAQSKQFTKQILLEKLSQEMFSGNEYQRLRQELGSDLKSVTGAKPAQVQTAPLPKPGGPSSGPGDIRTV